MSLGPLAHVHIYCTFSFLCFCSFVVTFGWSLEWRSLFSRVGIMGLYIYGHPPSFVDTVHLLRFMLVLSLSLTCIFGTLSLSLSLASARPLTWYQSVREKAINSSPPSLAGVRALYLGSALFSRELPLLPPLLKRCPLRPFWWTISPLSLFSGQPLFSFPSAPLCLHFSSRSEVRIALCGLPLVLRFSEDFLLAFSHRRCGLRLLLFSAAFLEDFVRGWSSNR